MKVLRYQLSIKDNGSGDKNIEIMLTDLSGRMRTRAVVDALVPALNQLKQTLADDCECLGASEDSPEPDPRTGLRFPL